MDIPQNLRLAMDDGDIPALEQQFYELGVLSEDTLDDAFVYAITNSSADVVGCLLRHGARLQGGSMSRYELRKRGDPAIYQKLLEHGWDIDSTEFGSTAVISAVWDNERLLRWLLDNGADPNKPNRRLPNSANNVVSTPLAHAAAAPKTTSMEILLSYGAAMDNEALYRAIGTRAHPEHDHVPHLAVLLENGADVNYRSSRHGTPLKYAIHLGRETMVEFLLERGADPFLATPSGTPAEQARSKGRMDIYDMIMRAIDRAKSSQDN